MHEQSKRVFTQVGSPYYMSPQILFNEPYWFKTDIYSLGVLAYRLLFYCFPYPSKSKKELAKKTKIGEYELEKKGQNGRKLSDHMRKLI